MQRKQLQQTKPFCKVCRDAGKTEAVYTSHYVKSRDGMVTCPTLKNLTCRYCKKNGHTISHCSALKQAEAQPKPKPEPKKQPQPKKEDLFPALPCSKPTTTTPIVSGYADMLKKEPINPPKKKPLPMPTIPCQKKKDHEDEYQEEYQEYDDYDEFLYEEQEQEDLYEEQEEDYDW